MARDGVYESSDLFESEFLTETTLCNKTANDDFNVPICIESSYTKIYYFNSSDECLEPLTPLGVTIQVDDLLNNEGRQAKYICDDGKLALNNGELAPLNTCLRGNDWNLNDQVTCVNGHDCNIKDLDRSKDIETFVPRLSILGPAITGTFGSIKCNEKSIKVVTCFNNGSWEYTSNKCPNASNMGAEYYYYIFGSILLVILVIVIVIGAIIFSSCFKWIL